MSKETGLAKKDAGVELAVMGDNDFNIMEAMRDELGEDAAIGVGIFSRVKMPKGDGRTFEVENDDDPNDPEIAKTITGVVVLHHAANAYFSTSYDEKPGEKPDCSSNDGITGHGARIALAEVDEGEHDCSECPLNEFGSSEDGGKMCTNRRKLYILRENDLFPILLSLPPTSLGNWRTYVAKNIKQQRRIASVLTTVSVDVKDGKGRASFAFAGNLSDDQAAYCKAMGDALKPVVTEYTAPMVSAPESEKGPF